MIPTVFPQGYFIDYPKEQSEYQHQFCGPHEIVGANCPNCDKPLLRFFSFDTADPRLGVLNSISRQIHLLYCWTCNVAQSPFFYRCLPDGSVELLQHGQGGVMGDFPYEDYPCHFPGAIADLIAVTPDQQRKIIQLNTGEIDWIGDDELKALFTPTHQIGGEASFVQSREDYTERCPLCAKEMKFLASVGDHCLLPQGFVDNDYVQICFSLCPTCKVIGAVQRCD